MTFCTHERRAVLTMKRDLAGALDLDLGRASPDGHASVLVACAMPDHVHVLVSVDGLGQPIWQYVRSWKAKWSVRLALPGEKPFWQRSFYDHWMRKDEEGAYAAYILANPVRKRLVADWREYPHSRCYVSL